MKKCDVYLYGMTVLSTMHYLRMTFQSQIVLEKSKKLTNLPGGETGKQALVLSSFGCSVRIDW